MIGQSIRLLLFGGWLLCVGCSPREPLPADTWSEGCVELAPYQQGYRISGLCCSYVLLPAINVKKDRSFAVKADYYTFTGVGFVAIPTLASGQLSADGSELRIHYPVNAVTISHTLRLGRATTVCPCGCD